MEKRKASIIGLLSLLIGCVSVLILVYAQPHLTGVLAQYAGILVGFIDVCLVYLLVHLFYREG